MPKAIDLTGMRFGKLTIVSFAGCVDYPSGKKRKYLFKCDCGNSGYAVGSDIKSGKIQSCGCLNHEKIIERNTKHKMTNSRIYRIYKNMKSRCLEPNHKNYHQYGGRGITICQEWLGDDGSSNFINWALSNGYKDDLTLDRIDNDKGYSPQNCRWVSWKVQQNNKRTNKRLNYENKNLTLTEWGELTGLGINCISTRLKRGWSVERALRTPKRKESKNGN